MTGVRRVGPYFGLLAVVGGLADPNGGLAQIPILFLLKDELHRTPEWVAWFVAATSVPGHVGFLFGALRDRWRPRRLGDRGYFLLVGVIVTASYAWLASEPVTLGRLLAGALVIAVAFQIFDASASALLTIVAQRHLMTGRLSSLVELSDSGVSVVAMLAGGWLVAVASSHVAFAAAAAVAATIAIFGVWAPPDVRRAMRTEGTGPATPGGLVALSRHPAFWVALTTLLLYGFSPGSGTPFFFS